MAWTARKKAGVRGGGCGGRTAVVVHGIPASYPASSIALAQRCPACRRPAVSRICQACRRSRFDPSLEKSLSSAGLLTTAEACDVEVDTYNQGTVSYAASGAYQLL